MAACVAGEAGRGRPYGAAAIATEALAANSFQSKPHATGRVIFASNRDPTEALLAVAITAAPARAHGVAEAARVKADSPPAVDRMKIRSDAAEVARREAGAEGLTLQLSNNATGYRGVYTAYRSRRNCPFKVRVRRDGKQVCLGYWSTAERRRP